MSFICTSPSSSSELSKEIADLVNFTVAAALRDGDGAKLLMLNEENGAVAGALVTDADDEDEAGTAVVCFFCDTRVDLNDVEYASSCGIGGPGECCMAIQDSKSIM